MCKNIKKDPDAARERVIPTKSPNREVVIFLNWRRTIVVEKIDKDVILVYVSSLIHFIVLFCELYIGKFGKKNCTISSSSIYSSVKEWFICFDNVSI